MRGYVAMTAHEVAEFMATGSFDVSDIYAPTSQFIVDHQDLDDVEMKTTTSGIACVLACEIPAASIAESHDMSISLSSPLLWENVECLFEVSADGEDLTWFATQEIEANLANWLK